MANESNHDLKECKICAWNRDYEKGCDIYTDKNDVILDDEGKCYSCITDPKEKTRIISECRNYFEERKKSGGNRMS